MLETAFFHFIAFNAIHGPLEEIPWRGTKNTTYEGGIRVPFLLRWPGRLAAGTTNDSLVSIIDVYPTLVMLAGGSLKQELPLDGLDMNGVIFRNQPSPRNEIVIEVAGSVRLPTLRRGDFKLVGDELYNLASDPGEKEDIAAQHPDVVAAMKARLKQVAAERPPLGDLPVLMEPVLPYVYGRDGKTGKMRNCKRKSSTNSTTSRPLPRRRSKRFSSGA